MLLRAQRRPETSVLRPAHLLLAATAAQVLVLAILAWNSDYWYDDLLHLGEVHTGLGASYHDLMLPVFGHMIPGFRLVFWLLQHVAPGHYRVALAFELLCSGGITLVLGRVLRLVSNRPLASAVIASVIGLSAIQVATFTWFSQALVALPSTLFTLISLERFLVWRQDRRPSALLLSLLSWAVALAFYEKAALLPLWLLAVVALLGPGQWSWRELVRRLTALWPAWLGFAGVGLIWLWLYHSGQYGSTVPKPSANQLSGFITIAWFHNFWISVAGGASLMGVPQGGTLRLLVGQAVFLILVAATIAWRRGAWRSWAFFLAAFVIHVGLVGYGRAGWGAELGSSSFYTYETGWLLAIALAGAVARASQPDAVLRPDRPALATAASPAVTGSLALVLVLLAGVVGSRAAVATYRVYPGRQVHGWLLNAESSAAQVRRTGQPFSVFDDKAPAGFTQHDFPSLDRLSSILGLGYVSLRYDDPTLPQYRVDPNGVLLPAHFQVLGSWVPPKGSRCWQGPQRLPLSQAVAGGSLFWRLQTNQPTPVQVRLWTVGSTGGPVFATDTDGIENLPAGPSDLLIPLLPTAAVAVYVNAPAHTHVCVQSVQLGQAAG